MSTAMDLFDPEEWTIDRLDSMLAEPRDSDLDWRRFEIVDGMLVVSPPPMPTHEAIVMQLALAVGLAVPADLRLVAAARIGIGRSYRVSDAAILTIDGYRNTTSAHIGRHVVLAVEIESPSSITTDRVTKPAQYAAAGVTHYWRIETDPLRLVTYRLVDGVYAETGSWRAHETARITDPFPVEFEVGSLLPD